jgi:hypothetical protein
MLKSRLLGSAICVCFALFAGAPPARAAGCEGNDRGIVRLAITLHNQRNEVVLEGTHILMLRRRGRPI